MDVLLNFQDISLGVLLRCLFECVEALVVLGLNLLLHFGHFDLVVIFHFRYFLLQVSTLCTPLEDLNFENAHFSEYFCGTHDVLPCFIDLNITFFQLHISCLC